MSRDTLTRLPAEERRQLVIAAAARAFSVGGYAGTSTDAVARAAGVSQPYVVRIFGTKLELFLAVFEHATDRIRGAFEVVLDESPFDPDDDADWERLGRAYTHLVADRDLLMVMMHGFAAGGVEEIASLARACMGRIFTTLRRTGAPEQRISDFVAQGMLLNVMVSMRAPEHLDEGGDAAALAPMTECAFGDTLDYINARRAAST